LKAAKVKKIGNATPPAVSFSKLMLNRLSRKRDWRGNVVGKTVHCSQFTLREAVFLQEPTVNSKL
jgi:hypothetical protein